MADNPKKPKGFYSKSDVAADIKKSGPRVNQEVPVGPGNVAKAFNLLKNASKTGINPVEAVKDLTLAEKRAVAAKLEKVNPAPAKGKFPSEAEKPKGGTQIMQPQGTKKVIKINPEGDISSRPVSDKWKIVKGTVTINGKTTVEKHAIPNRNSTQANHSVTRVDRKTGRAN